jgi:hypothetical protein
MANNEIKQPKRTSLNEVYKLACTDEKFLNTLLKNPEEALRQVRLELTSEDMESMKKMLKGNLDVKGEELLKYLNSLYSMALLNKGLPPPPPPPWDLKIPEKLYK